MAYQSRYQSSQGASPDSLSPNFIRQIRNFMNNWLVEGGDFRFDGYRAHLRVNGGGTPVQPHPWKTTRNDDGATKRVSVLPGTINSLVPTNIFSPLTISGTGTEYVVLTMTSTGGTPESASLSIETTYPVPSATSASEPPTVAKDVLVALNDGIIYQIRETNLTATSVEVFQETVTNPSPSERQYIPWYRWEVGAS